MDQDQKSEHVKHDEIENQESQENHTTENQAEYSYSKKDVEELENQNAELKDKLMRALAENENIQKRLLKEKQDASKYAITEFARELLSVADNLRRALDSISVDQIEENQYLKVFVEGVSMTEKSLVQVLTKFGIEPVKALHEKFSHEYHQAMFEVETDEYPAGIVMEVIQTGYVIKDRLLRPALVGLSKPKKESQPVNQTV